MAAASLLRHLQKHRNGLMKTIVRYYRHYNPGTNEVLLPEIVVTPKGSYVPEGQKTIRVHQEVDLDNMSNCK